MFGTYFGVSSISLVGCLKLCSIAN